MCSPIPLPRLPLMQTATVHALSPDCPMRRRLLDIGFAVGETITPLFRGPADDPTAYAVRGTVIALRAEDAASVWVIPMTTEEK